MAQILSQNEIDELMSALTGGGEEPKISTEDDQVRDYDFKMANKFSKDQIKSLKIIFEGFARALSAHLSGVMRVSCSAEVMLVEEQAFLEFSNAMLSPLLLAIFKLEPMTGSLMMQMSSEVVDAIISRVFGGKVQGSQRSKVFTEVELATMDRLVRQILRLLSDAWKRIIDTNATLESIETSPQFAQIVAPSETVVIVSIRVKASDMEDTINICIPHMALEPIYKALNSKVQFEGSRAKANVSHKEEISKQISETKVTLHAVLDETPATIREILDLQVGDIICLNHNVHMDATLVASGTPKFKGKIGKSNGRFAIEITETLKEEPKE